jgi:hypothetical protein
MTRWVVVTGCANGATGGAGSGPISGAAMKGKNPGPIYFCQSRLLNCLRSAQHGKDQVSPAEISHCCTSQGKPDAYTE